MSQAPAAGRLALRGAGRPDPVRGPGLTVTLDDAPERRDRLGGHATPNDLVVHQQDIQAVVNALWAGGAEAMTIQGQRVIATTGIKCVGNTVVLHGVPYSPPYRHLRDRRPRRDAPAAVDRAPTSSSTCQYVRTRPRLDGRAATALRLPGLRRARPSSSYARPPRHTVGARAPRMAAD